MDELEETKNQLEETKNQLLRCRADFDNFKKRTAAESEEVFKFASEALVTALLPTIDNLERAVDSGKNTSDLESLIKGVALIKRQMEDVFERMGVKSFETIGKPFDPFYHEAVMQKESVEHPEHTVLEEMQKGYTLQGKVIRPAMVIVSKKETI